MMIMSRVLIIEVSTSLMSPLMRAMMSPLRSWEKNPRGSARILSYSSLLMSLTTPVRIGIITAEEPK